MFGDLAGHTSTSQIPDPALRMGADTGVTPDCPSTEDSDDMSVTNSKVENAMNHLRRLAQSARQAASSAADKLRKPEE